MLERHTFMSYNNDEVSSVEIRVLQYFLTVARARSISKAALELHITQPTLSRQIKELEDEFGKQLIIRGSRHITLTQDGILFKQYAQEIMTLVEKAQREMLKDEEIISGDIYIGLGECSGMRIIMKIIAKMQTIYPHIQFHLLSGNAQDISYQLDSGILDIGIFIDPVDLTKYDYFKLPMNETWGILMRKDSELAKYDSITPQLLKDKAIILPNQDIIKNEIAGWIGGNERKLNVQVTYNLINNIALLVEEGHYYAFTLKNLFHIDDKSPLCFKQLFPKMEANIYIAWKKYHPFSKQTEKFLELLKIELEKY
jgi:Transcriptional regulator